MTASSKASAQSLIVGVVLDSLERPIANARVMVGPPGLPGERVTETDEAGRFAIVPAHARPLLLTIVRLGFVRTSMLLDGTSSTSEATVHRTIHLRSVPAVLVGVETRAPRTPATRRRDTAGESRNSEFGFLLDGMPVTPGDLVQIAMLASGVMAVGAGDDAGVSIAGQPADRNHTSVDGTSYSGTTLPSEAVASAGVVVNAYAASRGQFSGGELAATTRSGTNVWGGALRSNVTPAALKFGTLARTGTADRVGSAQLSGGGGGALVPDRLYVYAAGSAMRRSGAMPFLDPNDADALRRIGVSPDTVRAFLRAVDAVGISSAQRVSQSMATDAGSFIGRIDYALGERHLATLRFDGRATRVIGAGASAYSAAGTGGEYHSADGGILGTFSSEGDVLRHDARAYLSSGRQNVQAGLSGPGASVQTTAVNADGQSSALIAFRVGGRPPGLSSGDRHFLELSDELSITPDDDRHRWKVGGTFNRELTRKDPPTAGGTYSFASIDQFAAGHALSFSRGAAQRQVAAVGYGAAYASDEWTVSQAFTLGYGLRLERSWYPQVAGGAQTSSAIDSTLRVSSLLVGRSDALAPETQLLPRFGFTYRNAPAHLELLGGAGMFRARIGAAALTPDLNARGTNGSLTCVGPAVRQPDWSQSVSDGMPCDTSVPSFAATSPPIALFRQDFGTPLSRRASLDVNWQFANARFFHLRSTLITGTHEPLARELTLQTRAPFALANENGRPVFVSAAAIDPTSGSVSLDATHAVPGLGDVREVGSAGRSASQQISAGLDGIAPWGGSFGLWYTFTRSRDLMNGVPAFGGSAATTAADPAVAEWAPRDFEQRNLVQASTSARVRGFVTLSAVGRVVSGVPYTPMVAGDINGDGVLNDRAFLFDPMRTTDASLARDMTKLLTGGPAGVATCLRSQLGTVAARNSCRTGWSPSFDVQANTQPVALGDSKQLAVMITVQNVSAGLDYLMHGAANLHGWGQYPFPDNTLLRVRGFDPETGIFRYSVNPAFGSYGSTRSARLPMAFSVQGRITFGADPARQAFAALMAMARTKRSPEQLAVFAASRLPNIAAAVLSLQSTQSFAFDSAQISKLQHAAQLAEDSLAPARRTLITALGSKEPALRAEARAALPALVARTDAFVRAQRGTVQSILTAAQWSMLPAWLRTSQENAPVDPPLTVSLPNAP